MGLKSRFRADLRSWKAMGTWSLVVRSAAIGAFAGFAAWASVFALRLLFDSGGPGVIALVLAVPRGALFAVIIALILRAYWNRTHRRGRSDNQT
jgi:hypothetical protein